MSNATVPLFQALADAICPPLDDEGRLGKHLDSEEIHAQPVDDFVSRLEILGEIDRRIAFWQRQANPYSAWYQGDIVKLATLQQLREFVSEMEAA